MKNLIKIGNVQKTHGIKGELTCFIQVNPDDFADVQTIFLKQNGTPIPYFVKNYHYNQSRLTVAFEDLDSAEQAKDLINAELWVDEKYVTEDEYIWVEEIIGYQIIDKKKGNIGLVDNFYKIPNNDLLATEINGKEVLIPANTHIVKSIEHKTKSIHIEMPEGLLEIYLTDSSDEPDDADEEEKA
jgi:16S rRNA processing protein RimM